MLTPNRSSRYPTKRRRARAGFTLIETVLAMVLGGMILIGMLGVFLSLRNMENAFSARYERTSELDITHTIITRAMLSLQMEEVETTTVTRSSADDAENENEIEEDIEPEHRARILLETDPAVAADSTGWVPQRFEMVNATPPVPAGLASNASGWYTANDKENSLDFSAGDGSQGTVRGVFELRPTGQRERVMQRLGLINSNTAILDLDLEQEAGDRLMFNDDGQTVTQPNWTLWWRPILTYEGEQLLYGQGPYPDLVGTPDEIRARLAGAVPLLRNIERCLWEFYRGDEFIDTYSGLVFEDIPAYAQIEIILTNGQYASWMFEIDSVLGNDPSTDGSGNADGSVDGEDDADDTNGGNGQPGNDDGGGRRPGGQINPNATRVINISDS